MVCSEMHLWIYPETFLNFQRCTPLNKDEMRNYLILFVVDNFFGWHPVYIKSESFTCDAVCYTKKPYEWIRQWLCVKVRNCLLLFRQGFSYHVGLLIQGSLMALLLDKWLQKQERWRICGIQNSWLIYILYYLQKLC